MAKHKIKGFNHESFHVTTSGNTITLERNATIVNSGTFGSTAPKGAIYEDIDPALVPHHNTYNIDGRVVGYAYGLETYGRHDRINVGAGGTISAEYAIDCEGDGSVITNRGQIVSHRGDGIFVSGDNSRIVNFGAISGNDAIHVRSPGKMTIVNQSHGEIFGLENGVFAEGDDAKVVNHGLIHGNALAINGGDHTLTIMNDGRIEGDIWLGTGKGTLDTRGGRVDGEIVGGSGDDILITDRAGYKLSEDVNGGSDTIETTVSYKLPHNIETLILMGGRDINGKGARGSELLIGNRGDNRLVGGEGFDTLVGGKGDDYLVGGADRMNADASDTFVFSTGSGHDTVADYTEFSDVIDFTGWRGIDSMADVRAHAHQVDEGLLIKLGHDSLLLAGYFKADLDDDGLFFNF